MNDSKDVEKFDSKINWIALFENNTEPIHKKHDIEQIFFFRSSFD